MTTLGIHYLTGYTVATDRTDSGRPEFPPHFGRVFMALAATYFETRGSEDERTALEWLEVAGAPSIRATVGHPRSEVKTYVPVNDEPRPPLLRTRQSRSFPAMRLDDPFVYLQWNSTIPRHLRDALEQLCSRVTRIGHSSSLVQMWVAEQVASTATEWKPSSELSTLQMRITEKGTLNYLERAFNQKEWMEYCQLQDVSLTGTGKAKREANEQLKQFPKDGPISVRPVLTRWQGYVMASDHKEEEAAHQGPFEPDLIVFARGDEEQRVLGLETTLQLTSALRNAAMKAAGQDVPEWLSGHQPNGKPSLNPHAAFFPLPFVGTQHADGHILGLAVAIPREIHPQAEAKEESLRRVLGSLLFREDGTEKTIRLWRNKGQEAAWEWKLRRETRANPYRPVALRTGTWTRSSERWASVTPVVLHHYPKRGRETDIERIVLESFLSAGFPSPVELRVQPVSAFTGVGHVKSMPEFAEGGEKMCRYQVHITVRFLCPVQGPVLVGRGRFRGYGLLRPMEA
jgi:CRISPR-associated protein Csb2